jgi:hypothetical protein
MKMVTVNQKIKDQLKKGMHLKGNYILIKGELCINKKRRELCKIKCSTIIL